MIVVFTSAESISYYLASMCVTMLFSILYTKCKAQSHDTCMYCKVPLSNHGILEKLLYRKMLFITLINQNNVTTCYSLNCKIHEHVHNKQESVLYEIIKTVFICYFC